MATRWYVRTEFGERGPISFQDVAFLIHDGQVRETGLVRREDSPAWQPADSVVGLLHAARRQHGLNERVISDDQELAQAVKVELTKNESQRASAVSKEQERLRIIEATIQEFERDGVATGQESVRSVFVWGPLALIVAAVAYATWTAATYDPFAERNFESEPVQFHQSSPAVDGQ